MSVTKANILSALRDFKTLQDAYNEEKFLTEQYKLPTATSSRLGGVKVGVGLSVDFNGILSCNNTGGGTGYTLPAATKNQLGGVKVGTGLETTADGTLNVTLEPGNNYTLPTASPTTKGGVKIGTGLQMNGDTLSCTVQGGTTYDAATRDSDGLMSKWDKRKLDDLDTYAEENRINNISLDGSIQPVVDKVAYLNLSNYMLKSEFARVYRFRGTVYNFDRLPTSGQEIGDVYNVQTAGGYTDPDGIELKAGDNVAWDGSTWDILSGTFVFDQYQLPIASESQLGGIMVGAGLSISGGVLSTDIEEYTLPTASPTTKGGVKIGTGLQMNADTLSVAFGDYTLPVASETQLGGIKVGSGLSMADGTLNVTLEAGEEYSVFEGATSIRGGDSGLVPAPSAGDNTKFLRGDGTWAAANMTVINQGGSTTIIEDKPAIQGALWQDYISGIGGMSSTLCLKLRYNDYEYNFHYDEVDRVGTTKTPLDTTPGMVYKLGTAESTVDGGLWYSLSLSGVSTNTPMLQVHRGVFNYGYHYDSVTYKGNNDNLWAYLPFDTNGIDVFNNLTWGGGKGTKAPETVFNDKMAVHPLGGKAWLASSGVQEPNNSGFQTRYNPYTIDFWFYPDFTTLPSTFIPFVVFGNLYPSRLHFDADYGFYFSHSDGGTTVRKIAAVRLKARNHFALVSDENSVLRMFVNGICCSARTSSGYGVIRQAFGYKNATYPMYIDHFRVTMGRALWAEEFATAGSFTPPTVDDYFK